MADLKCVVENCSYNKDCLCSKGDIMEVSMPVIVTAPAARALRRREREESLSVILCLIQAIPSVSTVRR